MVTTGDGRIPAELFRHLLELSEWSTRLTDDPFHHDLVGDATTVLQFQRRHVFTGEPLTLYTVCQLPANWRDKVKARCMASEVALDWALLEDPLDEFFSALEFYVNVGGSDQPVHPLVSNTTPPSADPTQSGFNNNISTNHHHHQKHPSRNDRRRTTTPSQSNGQYRRPPTRMSDPAQYYAESNPNNDIPMGAPVSPPASARFDRNTGPPQLTPGPEPPHYGGKANMRYNIQSLGQFSGTNIRRTASQPGNGSKILHASNHHPSALRPPSLTNSNPSFSGAGDIGVGQPTTSHADNGHSSHWLSLTIQPNAVGFGRPQVPPPPSSSSPGGPTVAWRNSAAGRSNRLWILTQDRAEKPTAIFQLPIPLQNVQAPLVHECPTVQITLTAVGQWTKIRPADPCPGLAHSTLELNTLGALGDLVAGLGGWTIDTYNDTNGAAASGGALNHSGKVASPNAGADTGTLANGHFDASENFLGLAGMERTGSDWLSLDTGHFNRDGATSEGDMEQRAVGHDLIATNPRHLTKSVDFLLPLQAGLLVSYEFTQMDHPADLFLTVELVNASSPYAPFDYVVEQVTAESNIAVVSDILGPMTGHNPHPSSQLSVSPLLSTSTSTSTTNSASASSSALASSAGMVAATSWPDRPTSVFPLKISAGATHNIVYRLAPVANWNSSGPSLLSPTDQSLNLATDPLLKVVIRGYPCLKQRKNPGPSPKQCQPEPTTPAARPYLHTNYYEVDLAQVPFFAPCQPGILLPETPGLAFLPTPSSTSTSNRHSYVDPMFNWGNRHTSNMSTRAIWEGSSQYPLTPSLAAFPTRTPGGPAGSTHLGSQPSYPLGGGMVVITALCGGPDPNPASI
ncbi:hypothetical protein BJ085DRAFT_36791 [Dimargaris cristalligena]|uniref:Uncharacterized protein n=1 Tax=Dimargaris cristalligena TaxID=215637 RepID=A0A4P9ZVX8_9FUNG|nr:hypothetical protein BJ085DRAFT_36791 [Dimargaris cristalligena]|eukprot:RKP37775.1 hypothetical protein BJ085DRAFT_36791 [Dimargaris cristalligena]